jgi:hypothetical protein
MLARDDLKASVHRSAGGNIFCQVALMCTNGRSSHFQPLAGNSAHYTRAAEEDFEVNQPMGKRQRAAEGGTSLSR